jgi:hypothetical protein
MKPTHNVGYDYQASRSATRNEIDVSDVLDAVAATRLERSMGDIVRATEVRNAMTWIEML